VFLLAWGAGGRQHGIAGLRMAHGVVFNIQRYSVHDGPGIRTTVFLKGCPLECAWCHNPEGISPRREMIVLEGRCIACGECRRVCAFAAENGGAGPLPAINGRCTWCGACIDACPTGARQVMGREMSVSDVLAEVRKDRVFFDESRGGVTFSGGEPLMQPEFLAALLSACQAEGLHTAVDTCGMARTEQLLAIAANVDLFLFDLKLMDDARHRQYTGVSNQLILENLRALGRVHSQIWVRVPLVPGVNDDEASLESMARFAASVPGVRQVNVLPFHRTGLPKARRVGRTARLEGVTPPPAEAVATALALFRKCGLEVKAGG
jgi:pyruvate formate lyase activating enzyme